jgi:hypothetical protein
LTILRSSKTFAKARPTAIFLIAATVTIASQALSHEQWYQCIRSKETHERQAVMGSKFLSLGQGLFRQSRARTNPKLMIAPGWESGECLMNIQIFEEPSSNTT